MMFPSGRSLPPCGAIWPTGTGRWWRCPASLARKVAQEGDLWESTLHTMICLEVLESFDLVTLRPEEGGALRIRLQKRRGKGKVALYQAPIIQKLQACLGRREKKSFELIRGAAHVPEPVRRAGARREERDGLWKTSWRLVFRSWKRN